MVKLLTGTNLRGRGTANAQSQGVPCLEVEKRQKSTEKIAQWAFRIAPDIRL